MTTDDPTEPQASTTTATQAATDIRTAGGSDADGREQFAADLRELRLSAGSPTLAALGHTTGVSKTVLSEAFSGRRLPSARTVAALVTAFDGDVRTWVRRRDALDSAAASGVPLAGAADDDAPPPTLPAHPVVRRRTTVLVAAAAFVVGALVAGVGTGLAIGRGPGDAVAAATPGATGASVQGAVATGPAIIVANGTDPADTACVEDAKVVASETRAHDTQLQIVYSAACHAAWSRITRYDAQSNGNTVTTSIYRQIAPHAKDRQTTTEPDAESAYTTLIVRPSPSTRLCADGSITVDGAHIDLGDPLCL